jgi:hypothetical protein
MKNLRLLAPFHCFSDGPLEMYAAPNGSRAISKANRNVLLGLRLMTPIR